MSAGLTVGDLRKALWGKRDDLPVVIKTVDHEYQKAYTAPLSATSVDLNFLVGEAASIGLYKRPPISGPPVVTINVLLVE